MGACVRSQRTPVTKQRIEAVSYEVQLVHQRSHQLWILVNYGKSVQVILLCNDGRLLAGFLQTFSSLTNKSCIFLSKSELLQVKGKILLLLNLTTKEQVNAVNLLVKLENLWFYFELQTHELGMLSLLQFKNWRLEKKAAENFWN